MKSLNKILSMSILSLCAYFYPINANANQIDGISLGKIKISADNSTPSLKYTPSSNLETMLNLDPYNNFNPKAQIQIFKAFKYFNVNGLINTSMQEIDIFLKSYVSYKLKLSDKNQFLTETEITAKFSDEGYMYSSHNLRLSIGSENFHGGLKGNLTHLNNDIQPYYNLELFMRKTF
jgi:hypothetical protein